MAGGRDEKSLTPMRGFEIISTNHRFNPSSFFLILALVWTALTLLRGGVQLALYHRNGMKQVATRVALLKDLGTMRDQR